MKKYIQTHYKNILCFCITGLLLMFAYSVRHLEPAEQRHASAHAEVCYNGLDDDLDGLTDCDDGDCTNYPGCLTEICDNGVDDELDGLTDCDDGDCTNDPHCINDNGHGAPGVDPGFGF